MVSSDNGRREGQKPLPKFQITNGLGDHRERSPGVAKRALRVIRVATQ